MLNQKKMKGDYEFINVPLGVIMTVGLIVAIVLVVQTALLSRAVDMKDTEKAMQAVDASKIAYNCLKGKGGGMISGDTLARLDVGDTMCSMCRICSVRVGATIQYLEGPKKGIRSNIDYVVPEQDPGLSWANSSHTIFVNVNDKGIIYVSKMTVLVY